MKKIIWKISLRNLLRHRGKSIIIGVILFLGSLIMTMGNAMINGQRKSLNKNMVHGMTGDFIIVSTNQIQDNVFSGMPRPMKVLSDYDSVAKFLKTQKEVADFMPATYGVAMILGGDGHPMLIAFMGVNFKAYGRYFPDNIKFIEGRQVRPGEKGMIINNALREDFYSRAGFWPIPKGSHVVVSNLTGEALSNKDSLTVRDNIVIMGIANSGSFQDIRLPVRGIFEYRSLNEALKKVNLMDIESFRNAFGLVSAADKEMKLSKDVEKTLSLDTENLDNMFSDSSLEASVKSGNVGLHQGSLKVKEKKVKKKIDWKKGNFHFISVKLKPGVNRAAYMVKIGKALKKAKLDARVISWDKAVGQIGGLSIFLSTVMHILVVFVYFVAAMIIMNTLTMNAIERTNEIGMMRAVGAQKRDIQNMFFVETLILSGVFGTLGILTGMLASGIIGSMHIHADNPMLQLVFGGDTWIPLVNWAIFIRGLITLLVVTFLAILYPAKIAKNITPLEAISRE